MTKSIWSAGCKRCSEDKNDDTADTLARTRQEKHQGDKTSYKASMVLKERWRDIAKANQWRKGRNSEEQCKEDSNGAPEPKNVSSAAEAEQRRRAGDRPGLDGISAGHRISGRECSTPQSNEDEPEQRACAGLTLTDIDAENVIILSLPYYRGDMHLYHTPRRCLITYANSMTNLYPASRSFDRSVREWDDSRRI